MKSFNKRSKSTMWIAGNIMGTFMMSIDSPDEKKRRLIPLPDEFNPADLLNCEVVKILK